MLAVSYITKLLNWKQITTSIQQTSSLYSCFLYHKVTKLKANHNNLLHGNSWSFAVSYITKLLNWKQITTGIMIQLRFCRCFLYHKVTKLKANHNYRNWKICRNRAVSYITKLLNWKQITTDCGLGKTLQQLFPISQSY